MVVTLELLTKLRQQYKQYISWLVPPSPPTYPEIRHWDFYLCILSTWVRNEHLLLLLLLSCYLTFQNLTVHNHREVDQLLWMPHLTRSHRKPKHLHLLFSKDSLEEAWDLNPAGLPPPLWKPHSDSPQSYWTDIKEFHLRGEKWSFQ